MANNLQQYTHKKVQSSYNEKCAKYLMFDLKRFRGVIFHGDAKFEKKTDLWFGT